MKKVGVLIVCLFLFTVGCYNVKKDSQGLVKQVHVSYNEQGGEKSSTLKVGNTEFLSSHKNDRYVLNVGNTWFHDVVLDTNLIKSTTKIYIIEVTQVTPDIIMLLSSMDIVVGSYLPTNSVLVKTDKSMRELKKIKTVINVTAYQPFLKISSEMADWKNINQAKVMLWGQDDISDFEIFCNQNNIDIGARQDNSFIVYTTNMKSLILNDAVLKVEKVYQPELFSFSGTEIKKLIFPLTNGTDISSSTAEKVAVFDVGLDQTHPDLKDNIGSVYEVAGDNDSSEFTSHGTHITGLINGHGLQSGGSTKGVNPSVSVDFFAMGDSLKGLIIPPSMKGLISLTKKNGVHIINLSWGTYDDQLQGKYLSISKDLDTIVYENPDLILLCAVGNNGKSIASPATAKNLISIGSLDGNVPASYSGKNNTYDGRIKPEISVQGSGIRSLGLNGTYEVKSGTSQATAVASGLVSLLTRSFNSYQNINVTHSLMKAFLVANSIGDTPLNGIGWGKLYLDIPIIEDHFAFAQKSDVFNSVIRKVKKGDTLTVALSWTDPPGNENSIFQLVNDYDLEVTAPSGRVFVLNDHINNTEKIVIRNTEAGEYNFRVVSKHTPFMVNDISLVVRSKLGFGSTVEENEVVLQDQSTIESTTVENSQFVSIDTDKNTGIDDSGTIDNTGIEQNSTLAIPESTTSSPGPAISEEGPFQNLATKEESIVEPIRLHANPGTNALELRILGDQQDQLIGVNLIGKDIKGEEKLFPLQSGIKTDYTQFPFILDNTSQEIPGHILLYDSASGTSNTHPILLSIDNQPPVLGARSPLENQVTSNSLVWIGISDQGSGVNEDLKISVNGRVLNSSQFSYHFGMERLHIYLDQIMVPDSEEMQQVHVKFIQVKDKVGNVLPETNWNFQYVPGTDTLPPEMPQGLIATISNNRVIVTWLTNNEIDLAGYNIYTVSKDYASQQIINTNLLITNFYSFTASQVDKIGVSAQDFSTNESALNIIALDYQKENYPPLIIIKGVPESTNKNVRASIYFQDEGYFILTNVHLFETLSSVLKDYSKSSWVSNNLVVDIDESGVYTLFVDVMDNDSNRVTNSVRFTIDQAAPDMPAQLTWNLRNKSIDLSWTPVFKNEQECKYLITLNGSYPDIKGQDVSNQVYYPFTNASINVEDYGIYTIGVSTIDNLGNRGLENQIEINTETGLSWLIPQLLFNKTLDFELTSRIAQTSVDHLSIRLFNSTHSKEFIKSLMEQSSVSLDLQTLPAGNYTLQIQGVKDGKKLIGKFSLSTNITIDNTSPVITFRNDQGNVAGNLLISSQDKLYINTKDDNFKETRLCFNQGAWITYPLNNIELVLTQSTNLEVMALDSLGNYTTAQLQFINDKVKPVITLKTVTEDLTGEINDPHLAFYQVWTNKGLYYHSEQNAAGVICTTPQINNSVTTITILAVDLADNSNQLVFITNTSHLSESNYINTLLVNGTENKYYNNNHLQLSYHGHLSGSIQYQVWQDFQLVLSSGLIPPQSFAIQGLKDGQYRISLMGNGLVKEHHIVIDTIAPKITAITNSEREILISELVQIEDSNLMETKFYLNNRVISSDTLLPSGFHEISVYAEDKAGNSASLNPLIYVSTNINNIRLAHFKDLVNGKHYNKPVQLSLLEAADHIQYYINGREHEGLLQNEGKYLIRVEANKSGATNIIYTNTIYVALDFTPPDIQLHFSEGQILSEVPFIIVEDLYKDKVAKYIDGILWNQEPLKEGRQSLTVTATDKAGNTNTLSRAFYFDNTPPLISLQPQAQFLQSLKPNIEIKDGLPVKNTIKINGKDFSSGSIFEEEGEYVVLIYTEDQIGNTTSLSRKYTVDKTKPKIYLNIHNGYTYQTNLIIHGVVEEAHLSNTVMKLNNVVYTGQPITNSGKHVFEVHATDMAGNTAVETVSFEISAETPKILVQGLKGKLINGKYFSELNQEIVISIDKGTVNNWDIKLNGQGTNTRISVAQEGEYSLSIQANVTLSGKTFNLQESVYFIVDKTPPIIMVQGVEHDKKYDVLPGISVSVEDHIQLKDITLNGRKMDSTFNILQDGNYSLAVTAVDLLNRTNKESYEFVVDRKAPVITALGIMDGGVYNTIVPYQIDVQEDHLQKLSITLNGQPINSSGYINLSGNYHLKVTAEDIMGRVSTKAWNFFIDRNVPVIAVSNYTTDMIVQELNPIPFIAVYDISLRGFEVSILRDGQFYQYRTITNQMNLLLDFLTMEGHYEIDVRVIDGANNISTTNFALSLDQSTPAITVAGLTNNGVYPGQVNFIISIQDYAIQRYSATLNGTFIGDTNSVFQDGEYELVVVAEDIAGNITYLSNHFAIDSLSPELGITGVTHNAFYPQDRLIQINITDSHFSRYLLRDYGASWDNYYSYTRNPLLIETNVSLFINATEDGIHFLSLEAYDLAGNVTVSNLIYTIDKTPPQITILGINDGDYVSVGSRTITVTVTDNNPDIAQAWLNGTEQFDLAQIMASGDGNYQIIAYARDVVSNETWVTNSFVLDTVLPVISISGVTNNIYYNTDRPIQILLTDNNIDMLNSTVIYNGAVLVPTSTGSGFLYFEWTETIEQTYHDLSIYLLDLAGNSRSENIQYSLDKTMPVISINRKYADAIVPDEEIHINASDEVAGSGLSLFEVFHIVNGTLTNFFDPVTYTAQGEYRVIARADDQAGNQTVSNILFYVDTTSPDITFNNMSVVEATYQEVINVDISVSDNRLLKSVQIYEEGVLISNIQNLNTASLPVAFSRTLAQWGFTPHEIRVVAEDWVGRTTESASTMTFVDNVAPTLSFVTQNTSTYFTALNSTTFGDGQNYQVIFSGADKFGIANISATCNYQVDLYLTNFLHPLLNARATVNTEKEYHLSVTVTDNNGNSSIYNYTFIVDKKAPTITYSGNMGVNGTWDDAAPPDYAILNFTIADKYGLRASTKLEYHILAYWGVYNELTKDDRLDLIAGPSAGDYTGVISRDMWAYNWGIFGDVCSHHAVSYFTLDIRDTFGNRLQVNKRRFDGHRVGTSAWTIANWDPNDFPEPCPDHTWWW